MNPTADFEHRINSTAEAVQHDKNFFSVDLLSRAYDFGIVVKLDGAGNLDDCAPELV